MEMLGTGKLLWKDVLPWSGGKGSVGSWDLLVNEVTEHRFSKHWNTCFDKLNYLGRTLESDLEFTNDFLGKCRVNGEGMECDWPSFVLSKRCHHKRCTCLLP